MLQAVRRVRPLLGNRSTPILALTVSSVGAGVAEAGVLGLIAEVAAAMVLHNRRLHANLGLVTLNLAISHALAIALALAMARLVLGLLVAWLPARISADVQARLRVDLFDAYTRASWSVQAEEGDGHLQELMTNQVMQATQSVVNLTTLIAAGLMFLTLVGSAFALNVLVAVVVLASAIGMFALLRPLARRGQLSARDLSKANIEHAAGVSESVELSEVAQVFGMGTSYRRRVAELIEESRRAFFRVQLTGRLVQNGYQSLVIVLIVIGLLGLYLSGSTNLPSLGALVLMLVRASSYGQQFQTAFHGFSQMQPYLDRLEVATERYARSRPIDDGRSLPTIETLAFDSVTFFYRVNHPVLNNVTFVANGGEAIGIVGPTGAGKSTIVQILLRLRDADSGSYLVNGSSASSFARSDWQRRVAYVAQDPRIFHGTVADNIRIFRDVDQEAIEHAARLANIHTEIEEMPNGYLTTIGQRADGVSGGQRQRICLARALAGKPDVLVLDEPTSSLDLNSEAAVQTSLADLRGHVTMFIVAHRLSLLKCCDRVLVLEAGRVLAFDSAEELERSNAFYQRAISLMADERA